MDTITLAKAVYAFAESNYNKHYGYQTIVECMTIKEIAEELKDYNITTEEEALKFYTRFADLHNERYEEVMAEVF